MYRDYVEENIRWAVPASAKLAISFSGGTDSLCLLFSALKLGFTPTLYTYYIPGRGEDWPVAQRMAKELGLTLIGCPITPTYEAVLADVKVLLARGIRGEVRIQCMNGHLKVAPEVREPYILNGSGIDALYGVYKGMTIQGRHNRPLFDQLRQEHLGNPNDDAMVDQADLYAEHGTKVVYPFRQPNIIRFLLGLSWEEINRPRLKNIAVKDYPEFAQYPKLWRPRGSQQLNCGTKGLHYDLLLGSQYNKNGYKRLRPVYEEIAREV